MASPCLGRTPRSTFGLYSFLLLQSFGFLFIMRPDGLISFIFDEWSRGSIPRSKIAIYATLLNPLTKYGQPPGGRQPAGEHLHQNRNGRQHRCGRACCATVRLRHHAHRCSQIKYPELANPLASRAALRSRAVTARAVTARELRPPERGENERERVNSRD